MRRTASRLLWLLALVGPSAACGGGSVDGTPAPPEGPRLVVLLSVDQLRADLLDRYDSLFTGGFRRLRDEGLRFTNGQQWHAHTETAAGHAAIGTGRLPRNNGIVANGWFERGDGGWRSVYAVEDSTAPILGFPGLEGRSPANLLTDGLADWMLAADPASKVVSVSRKDRSAITLAGRARGQVYWLAPGEGRFVTSTWYRDAYPDWVERFHRERMPEFYEARRWTSSVPARWAALTRGDTASYEGDGVHTAFPHEYAAESDTASPQSHAWWIAGTPFVDEATLAFARAAVEAEALGEDAVPDLLAVGLSQADIIGHGYGPLSREQLDNLLRLDEELGAFLDFLDEEVGQDRWVLGLSADHGVLTMPEYLEARGERARRVISPDLGGLTEDARTALAGGEDPEQVARRLAEQVEREPWVAAAYPRAELAGPIPDADADSFRVLYWNSYHPDRASGALGPLGLELRVAPNTLVTSSATGTSHGSPYWYDRSVPVVLLGPGVEGGVSDAPARTIDLAPTLARLVGLAPPPGIDGRPLPTARTGS